MNKIDMNKDYYKNQFKLIFKKFKNINNIFMNDECQFLINKSILDIVIGIKINIANKISNFLLEN